MPNAPDSAARNATKKPGSPHRVLIIGGGFAGIACARGLGNRPNIKVTLVDRRNHHLFQPLLYQVAMAGLSPADIASPIRSLMSGYRNVAVAQDPIKRIDKDAQIAHSEKKAYEYDTLVVATGATHTYFGNDQWEPHAPGIKSLEQATEIRRRVLSAFERAENETNPDERRALLTFVVVGGGPTGVELAGAIGEMSRTTLNKDFNNIDPRLTRVVLVEAGPRILASFDPELSSRATRDLERLGVQVWTQSRVTLVDAGGVSVGEERIASKTVVWGAGVKASTLGEWLSDDRDRQGRVTVQPNLSLAGYPNVFVLGDLAHSATQGERPLPAVATVAKQQGRFLAKLLRDRSSGRKEAEAFKYHDKGQMATIGRSRAVMQSGRWRFSGFIAWISWLAVHIYYLNTFRGRLLVLLQWSWSYLTFARGARLILGKEWQSYPDEPAAPVSTTTLPGSPSPTLSVPPTPPSRRRSRPVGGTGA